MELKDKAQEFNDSLNGFIKELKLWIPLFRMLIMSREDFHEFWGKFSKLHKEKKIYSDEVVDRMKKILLKLRTSQDECQNLSDKELLELLSFSASQEYMVDI